MNIGRQFGPSLPKWRIVPLLFVLCTRVAAQSYRIDTVAGGLTGYRGAPTSVAFSVPAGVAVDAAGNLYIADSGNNLIWKVAAATGFITIAAGNQTPGFSGDGGPATDAVLYSPQGVAVDSAGNLYIADLNNSRVRKVAAATGFISTVAGNGIPSFSGDGGPATSASLLYPDGVAVDSSGNLYIADYYNRRIRKVAVGTGIITTVAGNGIPGFSGDGGPATSASFNPTGVAVDSSGNLYIGDYANDRIRKVAAATGIITTVAGNGTQGFSGDGGAATNASLKIGGSVAVDSSGNLYIADTFSGTPGDPTGNHRVRKVTAATGIITTVAGNGFSAAGYGSGSYSGDGGAATSAGLFSPTGVAVDSSGNLYISDTGNWRIRKVAAVTGIITTFAGNGTPTSTGDGGAGTSAGLYFPAGVAVDSSGNLYIAADHYHIGKVAATTGIITTVAGDFARLPGVGFGGDGGGATSASLSDPMGLTAGSASNLYIADSGNHVIRKVAATGIITTVAGVGLSPGFFGDGGQASKARLSGPYGVAVASPGDLYIADFGNKRIRKVAAATGIITTVAGNGDSAFGGDGGPATGAGLDPYSVAVDVSGNLYIADGLNARVRKVTAATGIITTIAGIGPGAGFSGDGGAATSAGLSAAGVALDSAGNLYIADQVNQRIRKVAAATGIITTIAGNGTTGFSGDGGAATNGSFNRPASVEVDPSGNVYIADTLNNRIRKLTPLTMPSSHPAFFAGEAAVSSTLNYLQFPNSNLFGYYGYLSGGWIFHIDMGYEYVVPGNGPEAYMFDLGSGHWWYTSSSLFPYLYDFSLNAWIYYFPDNKNPGRYTTNPRNFANLTTGKSFTM